MRGEDLTGKIFNKVEVLECIGSDSSKKKVYKVRCIDCGTIGKLNSTNIRNRGTFKCECYNKVANHQNSMIGKEYGDFIIDSLLKREGNRNYYLLKCKNPNCDYTESGREDMLNDNRRCPKCGTGRYTGRSTVMNRYSDISNDKALEDRYKGQVYGKIRIDSLAYNKGNGAIYFNCTCLACNTPVKIPLRIDTIKTQGSTKHCECFEDSMIGNTYGDLTVLRFSRKDKNRKRYYICRCNKCGTWEGEVRYDDIKNYGHSAKCDCPFTRKPKPKIRCPIIFDKIVED